MGAAPFTLFEVSQFQKHLERAMRRAVDVVTAKQIKNPNLAAAIEREKVLSMSAKATDLARIQEMFDLITETQGQIERLGITEERFKRPATVRIGFSRRPS